MPFIDLNSINPLNRKSDQSQGQTAQATDDQSNPPNDDGVADVVNPAQDVQAQVSTSIEPEVSPAQQPVETQLPVSTSPNPDSLEIMPTNGSPLADLTSPESTENTSIDGGNKGLDIKASSSSDDQNLDKSGNPLPQIQVSEQGKVKMDESGMREIKGPEFSNTQATQTPPAAAELDNQNLDQKLSALAPIAETNNVDTPTVDTTIVDTANPPIQPVTTPEPIEVAEPEVESPQQSQPVAQIQSVSLEPTEPEVDDLFAEDNTSQSDQTVLPEVQPVLPSEVNNTQDMTPTPQIDSQNMDTVGSGNPLPSDSSTMSALPDIASLESSNTVSPDNNVSPQQIEGGLTAADTGSIDSLLAQAIKLGASDLHLTASYRPVIRVDGKLQPIQAPILTDSSIKELLKPVIARIRMDNFENIWDLDMAYDLNDGTRFRVNIFKQQGTQSAVFRVIPNKIQSLEQLGLPGKVREFTQMSQGLVLVTGPTGSGKSTTLAAMVNEINMKDPRHIVTIEDPIEFVYPKGIALVDQRGIKQDTESWDNALRSVLRQDPDVVLIGEMRDLETIAAALHIAETGHLVFATLHTNSAAQSIDRIIDVFPKEQQAQIQTQLASVLRAIISQRLVPLKTGGRRAAIEILISTPAVANSIRSSKVYQIDNIIQTSGELGMTAMERSLADMVRNNLITIEQAKFFANRPDEITSILGKKG